MNIADTETPRRAVPKILTQSWIVVLCLTAFSLVAVACGTTATATATPTTTPTLQPTVTPTPTPVTGPALSASELKYRVIHRLDEVFVAVPVIVPREVRLHQARNAFSTIQQNEEGFEAILHELDLEESSGLTDEEKLLVLEEKTKLNRVGLEPSGGAYRFELVIVEGIDRFEVKGTITGRGDITILSREPSLGPLPVCLAGNTRIDTPVGQLMVTDLAVGMGVWTVDASGARVASAIDRVGSSPAPVGHEMVHLVLHDGRQLLASPAHPLGDGRRLEQLAPGDLVDGGVVRSAERVEYSGSATYDVLPAGSTGQYWANGILLGSTLFRGAGCGK